MAFLRKYNVLLVTGTTAIRIPIIKRAVVDFAVSADWTPASGDVKIAIDGAAPANVTNLPTAVASGNGAYWEFILTAAEVSCKQAIVTIVDAATKAIEDQSFLVETYGNASAMYAADLSAANLPANVVQLLGTAWLAPAVAGTPDVNAKQLGGTAQTGRDVGASVLLSAGSGTGQIDFTSGVVKANLAQILGTALTETAGQIAAAFKKFFNIATPAATMDHGILVDTVTTYTGNTPQTGDNFARLGAPAGASVSADIAAVKTDTGNLVTRITSALFSGITSLAQWLGLIAGKQVGNSTARTEVRATGAGSGTFDETTDSQEALRDRGDAAWITATGFSTLDAPGVRTAVGLASANLDTQLGAIAAYIDTEVAAIKAKTDTIPANPSAVGSAMTLTSGERDSIASAYLGLTDGIETGLTPKQALRLIVAALAGQLSGAATTTITIKAAGVPGTTRVVATVDADGNRSALTLTP